MNTTTPRNTWFVMDEYFNALVEMQPKLYSILAKDRDGDLISRLGGVDLDEERYSSVEEAKAAFEAANAGERRHYPVVSVEIVKHVALGKASTPVNPPFSWS